MAREPIVIRSGYGLGDSLYLQSIARHLIDKGEQVEVCSDWPDVFLPLKDRVIVSGFRRLGVNRIAHYSQRKEVKNTDQFQDMCIRAGIREPVDLRLDWHPLNRNLISDILNRAKGRKILAVQLPRPPMSRKDGFGASLLPDQNALQRAIDRLRDTFFLVQLGAGKPVFDLANLDLDLSNRTSVADLIDVARIVDGLFGYVSFFVPLAESFNKPALFVWSHRGLLDKREFVRLITPQKVLHKETSSYVFDNGGDFEQGIDAFADRAKGSPGL